MCLLILNLKFKNKIGQKIISVEITFILKLLPTSGIHNMFSTDKNTVGTFRIFHIKKVQIGKFKIAYLTGLGNL